MGLEHILGDYLVAEHDGTLSPAVPGEYGGLGQGYLGWGELSDDGRFVYHVTFSPDYARRTLEFRVNERISSSDDLSFQQVGSVVLPVAKEVTTNFAFDRLRNCFYTYQNVGELNGVARLLKIDVGDPNNPIVQTVDLDGFADELSGILLSPDGTTLYVGTRSDEGRSLSTFSTLSLFSAGGGEVGNPMPWPLPNPGGPISGILNDFNAMPQAISSDGRWLYGVRTVSPTFYTGLEYLQIVTLDLQSGTIYESDHVDHFPRYSVDSRILTLNEVKDEVFLKSASGISVFTTANNPPYPEYVGSYGESVWPSQISRQFDSFENMSHVGVSSTTGNVYGDTLYGFTEFSQEQCPGCIFCRYSDCDIFSADRDPDTR